MTARMTPRPFRTAALAAALALFAADFAAAQPPGRGGGGRGGGGRGGFGPPPVFENEGFQQEVGLTPDQVQKLQELREASRGDFDRDEIREKFQNANTDEERAKVREEIGAKFREAEQKFEEQSREVFTDEQRQRYEQVQLRSRGASAFVDSDERAEELGLSKEQREKMQAVRDEAFQKIRETGDWQKFRDPEFRGEITDKMLSVMNKEQRAKYDEKIGPEPKYDLFSRGDRNRGGGGGASDRVVGEQFGSRRDFDTSAPEGATSVMDIGRGPRTVQTEPSVGEGPAVDAVAAEVPAAPSPETMSFNFRYAAWEDVLKIFADFADLTLDPGPVPPGTFNYYDDGEYTATQALDILNGYLLQRGYVLVRRNRFLIVANIDDGIPPNLVPDVPLAELPDRGENELVRVILPLERGDAREAVGEVGPLLGPQGEAAALSATNSVVIRDTGGNVRRIVDLLANLGAEVLFEQIPLKFLDAYDAAQTVRLQLGLPPLIQNVSQGSGREDGRDDGGDSELSVTPDVRTQTLLVTAPPVQMRVVKEILAAVDVDEDALGNKLERGSSKPVFESFAMKNADAGEVAKTLEAMFPGSVVNEDRRAKTVQVYAPPDQVERIRGMIDSIDGTEISDTVSTVIPLTRMDPLGVSLTLNNMFIADGDNAPVIEADTLGRRLLIRATPEQVTEIKSLLTQLGEDGTGERTQAGTLRTMSLGGRDPEEFLPLLERLWNSRDTQPIRVVRPGRAPIVERAQASARDPRGGGASDGGGGSSLLDGVPGASGGDEVFGPNGMRLEDLIGLPGVPNFAVRDDADAENGTPEPPAVDDALDALFGDAPPAAPEAPAADAPVEPAVAPPPAVPAAPPADPDAPVSVSAVGGQLILYSENQDKLNELEDLVSRLGQAIPPRTQWTVFMLERADATETAELLDSLIPAASVSGMGSDGTMLGTMASGLSSFGGSLMDMTGVSGIGGATALRIIPDTRANALYVQGPADGLRQVEELLRQIDAPKPDTLRDRKARAIKVEYADVVEVADIVRELYKEQTADGIGSMAGMFGGRGGRGGGNPLAMLMGGGGDDDQDGPQVKLSIAVDNRTGRLLVSAPDDLFREIESVVEDLDRAAKDANRSVQFFTLRDANAGSVTASLGAMMPRVSGGSIVREPRTTGSSPTGSPRTVGSSGDGNSGGDDGAREAMRAMFLQRMMQQRGGGGGGEDGGGFGGGRGGGQRGGRGGRGGR